MSQLAARVGKKLHNIEDEDVVDYLIHKDMNSSGRTVVHGDSCPFLGSPDVSNCSDQVLCGHRHQSESLRVGIVEKLRKGFDQLGASGEYDSGSKMGNPVRSLLVKEYVAFIRREQGLAGVIPDSAVAITRPKLDRLLANLKIQLRAVKGTKKLKIHQRMAMYAFCFSAIKRWEGAGNVVGANVVRMPNNEGLIFNCTWDKTLRFGSHSFGLKCVKNSKSWCAHCLIDVWACAAKKANIDVNQGLLFPKLRTDGSISTKRWNAKAMNPILKKDLLSYGLYEGETPHSFRHGGTCDSLKEGKSLKETMYLAYMKNTATAQIYSKGIQILFPRGFSWQDVGIDVSTVSVTELSKEMKSWSAFM
jgi:hypothetical protein